LAPKIEIIKRHYPLMLELASEEIKIAIIKG